MTTRSRPTASPARAPGWTSAAGAPPHRRRHPRRERRPDRRGRPDARPAPKDQIGSRDGWWDNRVDRWTADVMDSITSSMTREEIAALLGSGRLYSPGRDSLYTVDELMAGYESDAPMQSLDARLAAHVKACGIPAEGCRRSHRPGRSRPGRRPGHARLRRRLRRQRTAHRGVMGGSSTPRDAPAYRLAAETAKALSEAGFLVATGGGLGIMEAGNLGAYFAGRRSRGAARRDRGAETLPDLRVDTKPSTSTPHA